MRKQLLIFGALAAIFCARSADFSNALPTVSVACLRAEPRHASELISQVVMGTPLRILEETRGGWFRIVTPEGYEGWVIGNALATLSDEEFEAWQKAPRLFVSHSEPQYVYADTISEANQLPRVSDLVDGSILVGEPNPKGRFTAVTLPDGRTGFVRSMATSPLDKWAAQSYDPAMMPRLAARYMGTPYLWGGTSGKSMDCSGLTKICAYEMGIVLPRDASQQAREGTEIFATTDGTATDREIAMLQPGDLLFFGSQRSGKVNHVGIYQGDGRFIHASGRVKVNSLRPSDPDYHRASLLSARRISPATASFFAAHTNPFYFPSN